MAEHVQKLIKQKDFADLAGVKPPAITQAKPRLGEAVVGRKIDVNHPLAQQYLEDREQRQAAQIARTPDIRISPRDNIQGAGAVQNFVVSQVQGSRPTVPEELAGLTIQEVVEMWGGVPAFTAYVKAQSALTDYMAKKTNSEHKRGELIDRGQQARASFEAIELLFKRFLTDHPRMLASKVVDLARQKKANVAFKVEQEIRAANTNILKICQNSIVNRLRVEEDATVSDLYRKNMSRDALKIIPMDILY